MRLLSYKGSDGKLNETFADSFGMPLNQAKKSHLGLSHLEFVSKMFDSHELFIGYKMKEYDKIGAISVKGEIYADFIYNKFEGVCRLGYGSIGDDNKQELWMGRKDGDLYDIYHLYELIYEDAINPSHLVLDDYTRDDRNYQYAQIVTEDGYKIYDIFNKQLLNFTSDDAISHIHSKHQRIILSKSRYLSHRKYEYTSTLIDFNGNVLGKYVGEAWLRFTENPNIFETYGNGKSGLVILENGTLEEVIPQKYRKITQLFKNKAVVINTQNNVKIVHFEKKLKKGIETWINKLDSYKFPKEVIAGFFLEDESEGILTLSNGKKVLLSLFLQGNEEKFQCEDIFYEGNSIFKCYQFKAKDEATITFICNGQSVLADSKDKDGHIVKIEESGEMKTILFTPDGHKIDIDIPSYQTIYREFYARYYNGIFTVDFMTIPKDEAYNLVKVYNYGYLNNERALFNLVKGTKYDYNYSNQMLWHNIFIGKDGYDLHTVRGNEDFLKPFKHIVAGFNDYAVFDGFHSVFIVDRKFNVIEIEKANVRVDEFYKACVISTKDKAYVVSNDGLEEFDDTGRIMMLPGGTKTIYKSLTSADYVVGNLFVDSNLLKYEISNGTIEAHFTF